MNTYTRSHTTIVLILSCTEKNVIQLRTTCSTHTHLFYLLSLSANSRFNTANHKHTFSRKASASMIKEYPHIYHAFSSLFLKFLFSHSLVPFPFTPLFCRSDNDQPIVVHAPEAAGLFAGYPPPPGFIMDLNVREYELHERHQEKEQEELQPEQEQPRLIVPVPIGALSLTNNRQFGSFYCSECVGSQTQRHFSWAYVQIVFLTGVVFGLRRFSRSLPHTTMDHT